MKQFDERQILGLIAVSLSTLITCFGAFWGIIEDFPFLVTGSGNHHKFTSCGYSFNAMDHAGSRPAG